MSRDNFAPKVVAKLKERVAHRCSNPDCRVPTIGPGEGPLAVANIGKAAHIAAAAPGGPRYDASMTPELRSSISNGIWLCSNCATKIDVDAPAYPTTLLHEWKDRAERTADAEKGRPQPRAEDARAELVGALTGMIPKFTRTAIQNAHGAVQEVLHALDPRLSVETSYSNKTTNYTVRAREQVDFKMNIPAPLAKEWSAGLQGLLDHGREAKLPATGVQMTGSPLLERLFDTVGIASAQITVAGHKKEAVQKLTLTDPAANLIEQFDDIHGGVSFGRKSMTFDGAACGGALIISFTMQMVEAGPKPTFNLAFDLKGWDGLDVQRLPHFEKMERFVQRLRAGWHIDVELEIDGQSMLRGSANLPPASDTLASAAGVLEYISMLRKIAAHLSAPIAFIHDRPISREEFAQAADVAQTIEGKRVFGRADMNSSPTTTVIAAGGNIRALVSSGNPDFFLVWVDQGGEFDAFGQTLALPKRETQLHGVRPKLMQAELDLSTIKDGDAVPIELEPTESFRCSLRYLRPGEAPLLGSAEPPEASGG
jgi:hypothetical protein